MKMHQRTIYFVFALLIQFCAGAVNAAVATTSFLVSAVVVSDCLVLATPLVFGSFLPSAGSNLDANASLTVTCAMGSAYNVGLDVGTGSGATINTRRMTRTVGGSQTLDYSIYMDSIRSTVWGNTIGVNTVASTGTGLPQLLTMYGRVPGVQSSPAPIAIYNDTVTVTVTY
jgi:spore coat protein U-like protein